jgi:acetoacetyl-CoA reductase/3-oxoacyl-[acyl-carrier protein] reductase
VAGPTAHQLLNGLKFQTMIIITGASKGVGKYLFNTFLNETSQDVRGTYFNSVPEKNLDKYHQVNVLDYENVENFITSLGNQLNDIVLINCAGIAYNSFAHKSEPTQWKSVVETNLFGSYHFIRAILPYMRNNKFGRIINFSSVVALKPTPGVSAYAASKSALWGMSKSIASENASLNITINNINLGYSELGMIETVPEKFKEQIVAQIPAGLLCKPKDIFNTVNYLIDTSYINGTSIDLNGALV